MTEEIWRPVVGYEGLYEVSNTGRVRSLDRYDRKNRLKKGKLLKNKDNGNGYLLCGLSKNGIVKNKYIHRLVAEAFIERPDGLYEVNHKDEDKTNNNVDNLEWCDATYNVNYGTRNIRAKETLIKNGYWIGLSKKEYDIKYWNEHRDHLKECKRKNYQENKEKRIEYQHQYYQENKEKRKEYCEKNKEKLKEYYHQYYLKRKAGL